MLRWTGVSDVPEGWGPSVVTVGTFDGVHRGHQHLVGRAVARARALGVAAVAVTFHPHPAAVLRPERAPTVLAPLERRLDLLAELGLDAALVLAFTRELAAEPPGQFVDEVLAGPLRARAVVVGEGFRFGHRAAGDVALLAALGRERGFDVDAVPRVGDERGGWSSSLVRRLVADGDVVGARRVLGRDHRVEGLVVHGDARGRTLGYPTANLAAEPAVGGAAVPADGVYAGRLTVLGPQPSAPLPAAVSIGTNPTFGGTSRRVEAYVLDRTDLDLYDRRVAVDLVELLRPTLAFASVEELLAQMALDVDRARAVLRPARTGGVGQGGEGQAD